MVSGIAQSPAAEEAQTFEPPSPRPTTSELVEIL